MCTRHLSFPKKIWNFLEENKKQYGHRWVSGFLVFIVVDWAKVRLNKSINLTEEEKEDGAH